MQTLKDSLKTIALSLSMLFFVGVAYAWTEPTDTPPNPVGGSIPLNTSSTFQDKVGDLWVSSLGLTNGLIVTGGDVGIGTTNPGTRLEVQAPTGITEAYNTAFRGTSNDGTKNIDLNIQNDGHANFGGNFKRFGIGTTNPGTRLEVQAPTGITEALNTVFRGRSNDGAKHIDLNIQNDGKANFGGNFYGFGIGTTSPLGSLDVKIDTADTAKMYLGTSAFGYDNGGEIHFVGANNSDLSYMMGGFDTGNSSYIKFVTNYPGNGNEAMRIIPNGVNVNGTVTATNFSNLSDFRWKKNVKSLENSLSKLSSIQGVNYEWKKEEYPDMNFNNRTQIGFIAQDVEKIIPEVVATDDDGYKSVSYEKLVPVLTEAIKDQQKQIEELKIAIEQLKSGK